MIILHVRLEPMYLRCEGIRTIQNVDTAIRDEFTTVNRHNACTHAYMFSRRTVGLVEAGEESQRKEHVADKSSDTHSRIGFMTGCSSTVRFLERRKPERKSTITVSSDITGRNGQLALQPWGMPYDCFALTRFQT